MTARGPLPCAASPLLINFDSEVELSLHSAFLPTARLLQCDPVARVSVVTIYRTTSLRNVASRAAPATTTTNITNISSSEQFVASTRRLYFTSRPVFNETLRFTVPPVSSAHPKPQTNCFSTESAFCSAADGRCVERRIRITLEDKSGAAIGQATCPFFLHAPNSSDTFVSPSAVSLMASPQQQQEQQQQQQVRVMLQPRNAHDPRDALFCADMLTLGHYGLDDFGFISLSWRVALVPHGGALLTQPPPSSSSLSPSSLSLSPSSLSLSPPAFPIGLVLRAIWLVPRRTQRRGTRYQTSVNFGGSDRFLFDGDRPLFLTIQSAAQLPRAISFHCAVQQMITRAESHDVCVCVPAPPLARFAMDRDVWWTSAVRTARGEHLGVLFASLRFLEKAMDEKEKAMCGDKECERINDPKHQAQYAHITHQHNNNNNNNNGHNSNDSENHNNHNHNNNNSVGAPDTPPGAFHPIFWESELHRARAMERRWKRNCLAEARPSAEHARHLLDVIANRVALDDGVARVASVFFHQPQQQTTTTTATTTTTKVSASDLQKLLIGCAFHAEGMTVTEAARFCFFALRREMEQAITKEDVVFLLEHALVGRTVDMPISEIRRRVTETFGDATFVLFEDFMRYFVHNYAMWYAFGIPVSVEENEQTPNIAAALDPSTTLQDNSAAQAVFPTTTTTTTTTTAKQTTKTTTEGGESGGGENVWRTFVARVQHSRKAFSVTAHVCDTVADVMAMVQNSTGIRAACQEWRFAGETLDPRTNIGATPLGLHSQPQQHLQQHSQQQQHAQQQELTIIARDETVRLVMLYREKGLRWELQLPETEKVLKLRALVQQRTMIPLSRCALRIRGTCMHDRHAIAHYKLQNGDTVEIRQE